MLIRSALLAAAAVLVVAASASASIYRPEVQNRSSQPPGSQTVRFTITATGGQQTDWREPEHATGSNCYERTSERGGGHERVEVTSAPTKFMLYRLTRSQPWQAIVGTYTLLTMPPPWIGTIQDDRIATHIVKTEPGDCGQTQKPPEVDTAHGCGTRKGNTDLSFMQYGQTPRFDIRSARSFEFGADCPVEMDLDQSMPGAVSSGWVRLPVRKLLALKPLGVLNLDYTRTFPYKTRYVEGKTTVRWRLRVFRIRSNA